jgi:AcrR family transcriptional regulator
MTKPTLPYHHGNLEEVLITQAAEIIASRGLAALSLRELGRSANVSRSAPYHYFKDKGALLFKIGELGFRRLGFRIQQALEGEADLVQQCRVGFFAYVQFAMEDPHFFRLMFSNVLRRDIPSDVTEDVSLPFSSSAAEETFSILINGIRKLQDAKILRVGNPLLLTNVFWAYSHGVAVLALDKHLKHLDASAVFNEGINALLAAYANKE